MTRTVVAVSFAAIVVAATGCSSSNQPATNTGSAGSTSATSGSASAASQASPTISAATSSGSSAIVNTWKNPGSVSLTSLPLGDSHSSTTTPGVGTLYVCRAGDPNGPGSRVNGPWIHGDIWNETQKTVVQGSVNWPAASFSVKIVGSDRVFVTNDLPDGYETGAFPIASTDPAYQYDRNPNKIIEQQAITITVPTNPVPSATPNCTPGTVGIMLDGVLLYDGVDATGRDAVAHEEQDLCQGHPQDQGQYHYHNVPDCLLANAKGPSTVVGYAYDGYPIVVERDAKGNLPDNADLDECHGRTSPILLNGTVETAYHYDATYEFPYTVGCLHAPSQVRPGP